MKHILLFYCQYSCLNGSNYATFIGSNLRDKEKVTRDKTYSNNPGISINTV